MKTLLITGGTGGLGTVVVKRLERHYRCVLLTRADLTNEKTLRAAISKPDAAYGLVHLAGGFAPGPVAETKLETWNEMLASNTTLAFLVIREASRRLERPGRIVAISSEASLKKSPGAAAYTVSKSALNALIEVTAAEVAGSGITANAICPGTLDTPASRAAMPDARRVPLERVADLIEFLLSDAAANINGALIPLPGG